MEHIKGNVLVVSDVNGNQICQVNFMFHSYLMCIGFKQSPSTSSISKCLSAASSAAESEALGDWTMLSPVVHREHLQKRVHASYSEVQTSLSGNGL